MYLSKEQVSKIKIISRYGKKSLMPIPDSVMLECCDGNVQLRATDTVRHARIIIGRGSEPDAFVLSPDVMTFMLGLDSDIEIAHDGDVVSIVGARGRARFSTESPLAFPQFMLSDGKEVARGKLHDFVLGLKRGGLCADEVKGTTPITRGACISNEDGKLVIASTDGLACYTRTVLDFEVSGHFSHIVPLGSIPPDGDGDVVIFELGESVAFVAGDFAIVTATLSGNFPPLPKNAIIAPNLVITGDKDKFNQSLSLALISTKGLNSAPVVQISQSSDTVTLRCVGMFGETSASADADIIGDPITVYVNGNLLKQYFSIGGELRIAIENDRKAIALKTDSWDYYIMQMTKPSYYEERK